MKPEECNLEGSIAWAYPEIKKDMRAEMSDEEVARLYNSYVEKAGAEGYLLHDGLYNAMIEHRDDMKNGLA